VVPEDIRKAAEYHGKLECNLGTEDVEALSIDLLACRWKRGDIQGG